MKSRTTPGFWKLYRQLPREIRLQARTAYQQWTNNPHHPGLFFKRVSRIHPVYSVRIGLRYRTLGMLEDDTIYWYWIGKHDEYDRLLKSPSSQG